jgi:taurine---2-oxoglutarate transaminase
MVTALSLGERHARQVLTPWSSQADLAPPMIVRGEGSFMYDADGQKYLDLSSGLVAVNLGHAHPRVVAAIAAQAQRLCYAPPSLFNDTRAALAAALSDISPWPEGARVFFTTGGAEANEDALKMARMLTGRFKILAAYRSFHGSTLAAASLTGEDRRWPAEPGPPGIVHFFAPYPYRSPFHAEAPGEECDRALEHLARVLLHEDPTRVAAIILEPVVGSNGVIVYPDGYLDGVRTTCARHKILLIFDEVMTGFGRVGSAFAARRLGVSPDLITFAKGVTSAYVPLGGVLVREALAQHFDRNILWCGHTYSGHPLAVAAGLAAVQAYQDEQLFERAREIEGWLRSEFRAFDAVAIVGEIRGLGAFFGIELVKDRRTREPLVPWHGGRSGLMKDIYATLRRSGVYAFGKDNIIIVAPPLTIGKTELHDGLQVLRGVLSEFVGAAGA